MDRTQIKKATEAVNAAGLTPIDLLSWEMLIELEYETRPFGNFIDIDFHRMVRETIVAALKRKAEMLDAEHGTNYYGCVVKYQKAL